MSPARKSPARTRTTALAGKRTGAARTGAKGTGATRSSAKKSSAKRSTTTKTSAKRSTARKAGAKHSTARKTGARTSAAQPLATYNRKRDFTRTKEPEGRVPARAGKQLQFVIQKHDASHLHYDLRLELDGVMKSWAVPKGPSLDPSMRRLAMEVEDHPISYNTFEGTIPEGEYGGGTVMLWDRGTYEAEDGGGADSLRRGYAKGDLKITLHGKRLRGSWVLVRMKRPGRPQWLLIKHRDAGADPSRDVTAEHTTSVASRRSMESITAGKGSARVWQSNR
jgi:DNA ligase D-like protein (predicted 3'-phosphoesterase)